MSKIGIFYGSTTGSTEEVASTIKNAFGEGDIHEVDGDIAAQIAEYDLVLLGTPTLGDGELQEDWEDYVDELDKADFSGRKVALFGLGDQDTYPDTFLDAMGILYEKVTANGATVIGDWPISGYDYDESAAVKDGKFVGLAIDEDNQADKTPDRVKQWVEQLRQAL